MKKLFISLFVVAATMNVFAQNIVAKADLTLKGATKTYKSVLTIAEITDENPGYYCAEMYTGTFDARKVAIYAAANSKMYEIFAANDVEGQAIGFKTFTDTEHTIKFANVIGTLYLFDAVANKYTEITEGGTYAFTAEANQTIADRFSITKVLPAKPYSFVNNVLVINEATVGAEVTVTPFTYGAEGKNLGTPVVYNVPVNQVLNGGYFLVTYTNAEGVAREFIVNANPDIQLANP